MKTFPSSRLATHTLDLSRILAITTVVIGCLAMVGWLLHIEIIRNPPPELSAMKFSTALVFTIAGIGLLNMRSRPRTAQAAAALVILIPVLTLGSYLLGWRLFVDSLVIRDSLQNPATNSMSPLSAFNFILMGIAFFLMLRFRRYWLAHLLLVIVGCATLVVLLGYLYSIQSLYKIGTYSSPSLQTSLLFIALSLGAFFAVPDQGFAGFATAGSAGSYMVRRLLPPAILVPLVVGFLRWQGELLGLYDTAVGLALFTVSNIFISSALIVWIAFRLHRIDQERRQAVDELHRTNEALDSRVTARTADLQAANQILESEIRERERTQARYRALIEHLPDSAVILFDRDLRYIIADGPILSKAGYSQEQMLGKTAGEVLRPESQSFFIPLYERVLQGETIQLERQTGKLYYDSRFVPVYDTDGSVLNGLIVVHDITERVTMEEVLRQRVEEEQELHNNMQALHEITIELTNISDLDVFYRRAVEFGLRDFGFERLGLLLFDPQSSEATGTYGTDAQGNLIDEYHLRFNPSDLTNILLRAFQRDELFAVDEEAELFHNFQLIGTGWNAAAVLWNGTDKLGWLCADNGVRHAPLNKSMLNILSLYALTLGNLLAQKRTQAAVRASERNLRLLAENSPDVIYILDLPTSKMTYLNRSEFLGYSGREIDGPQSLIYALHPDDKARVLDHWGNWTASGHTGSASVIEFRLHDKFGNWQWLESRETVFESTQGGEPTQVLVTLTVITERKQAEERAIELGKEREQVKMLSDFVRDTSHDFRTPLTVMSTNMYLLSRVSEPDKQAQYLKNAEQQISRLTRLIDRLQLMVRLDSQKSLEMSRVHMNPFIIDFCTQVEAEAAKKDITNVRELCESSVYIQANREELHQALVELGNNAVWYTPSNATITIRTRQENDSLIIEICDTGIGIAEGNLTRIFQRLYRVDDSRSSQSGGTGLGLPIAKRIVELHQGQIEVESVVGQGSIFRVILPLSQ